MREFIVVTLAGIIGMLAIGLIVTLFVVFFPYAVIASIIIIPCFYIGCILIVVIEEAGFKVPWV